MAKYGTGTNAMLASSVEPREDGRHVFKWYNRAGMRWLSQLCDEADTHLRTETLSRLTSSTSVPHAADGTETARVLDCILSEIIQTDPNTQGSKLKRPLGSWNELVHHRGYAGPFVEFAEPGKEPRLIDVSSTQDCHSLGKWGVRAPGVGIPANLAPRRAQ